MLSVKNLIDTNELTADDITQILDTAKSFDPIVNARTIKKVPALRGRTIVNLFLEPSTRTRSSFELAEKRLSADSLNMGGSTSSVVKGESLADTIQTIAAMNVDMFVCRAKLAGTPQKIAGNTDAVVINARSSAISTASRWPSSATWRTAAYAARWPRPSRPWVPTSRWSHPRPSRWATPPGTAARRPPTSTP